MIMMLTLLLLVLRSRTLLASLLAAFIPLLHIIQKEDIYYKKLRKYHQYITKKCSYRAKAHPYQHYTRQPPRNQGNILNVDIYERTGLLDEQFASLFGRMQHDLSQPRSGVRHIAVSLNNHMRLLMILHWLRAYPRLSLLQDIYHVSKSYISREIRHIIPSLFVALNSMDLIQLPTTYPAHTFENAVGAIDCSAHYRERIHPRQGDWYRGDKHAHFMASQIFCSLSGDRIYSVHLGMGHNNDMAMLHLTGMSTLLVEKRIRVLGDRGYHHHMMITPNDQHSREWNLELSNLRSVVEVVIGLSKTYDFASSKVRQSAELQELGLLIVYMLVAMKLKENPVRRLPT